MVFPQLKDFDFKNKKVIVRCDFDGGRLEENLPTIKYLLENGATKIILLSHLGRPEGKTVEKFSLEPIVEKLGELLGVKFGGLGSLGGFGGFEISENIFLLENLRFDKREEENDEGFAKELAVLGDFYVNEAFASSHREHASIVGIPKFLPHCAGLHFALEVENLSKVLENPKRPLVFVMGGAKPETKMTYIADFARVADSVLVGGLLAKAENKRLKIKDNKYRAKSKNIIMADLIESGFDINEDSIKKFEEIIEKAVTVVWNGPLGKVEEPEGPSFAKASAGAQEGTRRVGEAIVNSTAFRVVGGGDTISALKKFGLLDKMDYVSTGGGAMLEYLAKGTLPGINALNTTNTTNVK